MCVPMVRCQQSCDCLIGATIVASGVYLRHSRQRSSTKKTPSFKNFSISVRISADPGGRPIRTRRGRRAPGARRRGSRGGRSREGRPAAGNGASLTVGLINIQSLKPKLLQLSDQLHRGNYDLMALNETWLRPTTPSRLLVLPGYRLFRTDRPDGRGYGGVALAARDSISASPLKVTTEPIPNSRLETLWVMVKPDRRRKFVLGTVYRPPRRGVAELEADFSDLEALYQRVCLDHPMTKILVCGDLNCDFLKPTSYPGKQRLYSFFI